jgi:hypothetical protein
LYLGGDGSHFTVEAGGETVEDAACYYPEPKAVVKSIKAHVAFYGDEVHTGANRGVIPESSKAGIIGVGKEVGDGREES